jgi:chromosome segregation ATPase
MAVADLLRRASAQLDSEMRAARDYAHRRDSEVYELSVGKKQAEDDANTIRDSMNDELESLRRNLDDSLRAHEATSRELETLRRDNELAREDLGRAQSREQQLRDSWQTERSQMRSEIDHLTDQSKTMQEQLQTHAATKMNADAMCARSTEEILSLQRQNAACEARCRELDELLCEERETVKRLEETKRGSQEETDKKLEGAKAVVKQWTTKCKQLKEEHAQALSDKQRQAAAAEEKLRATEQELRHLKSELEQMSSSWKDEVATLRRDRMKERKRADAEASRAADLAQQASRSSEKSESMSSKLAAAESAAREAEQLKREHATMSEELKDLRLKMNSVQAAQAQDKDVISSLTLERDELAREVDETNLEWQSLQDEMNRLKEQLGKAIHGGEAAFLEANAAREDAQKHESELSKLRDQHQRAVRELEAEVDRLRSELSSTSSVVDRANRSVEDLQSSLQAERSKVDDLETKAKRQREAVTAAEEAAVRAHEAAEETVRGMMVNFR